MTIKDINVMIIGNLYPHPSSHSFLEKFVKISEEIASNIIVISAENLEVSEKVKLINLSFGIGGTKLIRILRFLKGQVAIFYKLLVNTRDFDLVIILPTSFVLPTIISRLLGKRVSLFVAQKGRDRLIRHLSYLNFIISDFLLVESYRVLDYWNIQKFRYKSIFSAIYVDTNRFKIINTIEDREKIVGYIGNLEPSKGINELLLAIPIVEEKANGVRFMVGGTGSLESLIREAHLNNLEFRGYIEPDLLANTLNQLNLLVLPSFTEGLPNILLESMACGTPVLVTPVGGVKDIVRDGETGFIMEDNSPN